MFEVNRPAIDYLTVTTFDEVAMAAMKMWHDSVQENGKEARRMQYTGDTRADRYGTSFLGAGEQKSMTHAMLQVSGMLAASAFTNLRAQLIAGKLKLTRIDLQVTVEYPRHTWSQADLFSILRDDNEDRVVNYVESKSGPQGTKLATVYYGSRLSERLVRIYEKVGMGDEVLLRFEVEYKGDRARRVSHDLLAGATEKAILWGEVLRLPDVYNLRRWFGKCLETTPHTVRVVREPGNTQDWLAQVVAPVLDRYLNQHEEDALDMAVLFHRIAAPHLTNGPGSTKL